MHEIGRKSIVVRGGAGIMLLLLAAIVYRGALGAGFSDDDFSLLALSRLLDNPLWLFVQNHMLSMPYYRPAGVAFWWVNQALFGHQAIWHYAINLALHCAVALVLWRFIVDVTRREWLGFGAALLFAIHPLAIGTALWLSDRFDLLAALFGLLALRAAWRFRCAGRRRSLVATLTWLLLALLSKEVAFALVPALALIWLWPGADAGAGRRVSALCLLLPVGLVLLARWAVLDTFGGGSLFAAGPPSVLLGRGLSSWVSALPAYFVFPQWMRPADAILAVLGGAGLLSCIVRGRRQVAMVPSGHTENPSQWLAVALGLILFLAPALVQWPMIGVLAVRDVDPAQVLPSVTDSRYYYLSLAGFLILMTGLLASAGHPLRARQQRRQRALLLVSLVLLILPFAAISQRLARAWRAETAPLAALVAAANQAIARLPLPQPGCQIYLLGTPLPAFGQYADDVIKATHADIRAVANCLVQTEHTPWHHLIPHHRSNLQWLQPLVALRDHGEIVPWPRVGNLDIAYLNLVDGMAPAPIRDAWFLEWRDGAFVDITGAVREGRRRVLFYCNRSPAQCP